MQGVHFDSNPFQINFFVQGKDQNRGKLVPSQGFVSNRINVLSRTFIYINATPQFEGISCKVSAHLEAMYEGHAFLREERKDIQIEAIEKNRRFSIRSGENAVSSVAQNVYRLVISFSNNEGELGSVVYRIKLKNKHFSSKYSKSAQVKGLINPYFKLQNDSFPGSTFVATALPSSTEATEDENFTDTLASQAADDSSYKERFSNAIKEQGVKYPAWVFLSTRH